VAGNRARLITGLARPVFSDRFPLTFRSKPRHRRFYSQFVGAFAASGRVAIAVGRALLRWHAPERTCQGTSPRSERQARLFFAPISRRQMRRRPLAAPFSSSLRKPFCAHRRRRYNGPQCVPRTRRSAYSAGLGRKVQNSLRNRYRRMR